MEAAARLPEPDSLALTFEDGLGQRFRTVGPGGEAGLEILTLRSSFATVPSFEFALRERAGRLAAFRHAYYARVRSVERASGAEPQLRVTSEAPQGIRLSDLLTGAQARRVPIDINAALCVIRQLVPAVAMLHENARDVAHGALAPERLLVTAQARLLIAEYVLGAALEQLRYPRDRYWTELRVPLPAGSASPRFDHRCDVLQIGVVALSLILGRPLRQDEFPDRIADVVASTWAVSPRGGFEPLPPGLRGWLARALQLDPQRSFPSAVDARAELDTVLGDSELVAAPASLEAFLARYHATEAAAHVAAPGREPVASRDATDAGRAQPPAADADLSPRATPGLAAERFGGPGGAPLSPDGGAAAFVALDARLTAHAPAQERPSADVPPVGSRSFEPRHDGAAPGAPLPATAVPDLLTPGIAPAIDQPPRLVSAPATAAAPPFTFDGSGPRNDELVRETAEEPDGTGRWWKNWRVLGAAVAVVAVIAAGSSIGARRPSAEPEMHAASGTLEVTTNPAGVQAFIDGELRGATPLVVALEPGSHSLELRGSGEPRSIPVTISPGAKLSQYVELSAAAPAGRIAEARASEPGGQAPLAAAATAPPTAAAAAAPANGFVTVTSAVDLQVFADGALIGNARERLSLPPGRHDLELVNADLGVRFTQSVQVAASRTATLTPDLPTGTLSLNAAPWAEVWLDGEKVGETPIGNLAVRVGAHDVVFRHPDLGERHQTVVVGARQPSRLSVTMQGR